MENICRRTRMTLEDVFNTLRTHGLISLDSASTPHSSHKVFTPSTSRVGGIARKNLTKAGSTPKPYNYSTQSSNPSIYDLTTVPTHYTITWDKRSIKEYLDKVESKGLAKLNPEKLRWSPYLVARARKNDPGSDGSLWDVEVDDMPEPSMHSHTPLEPIERPPNQRSNSGNKTPRRKSTANSNGKVGRTLTRNASPTPSIYDEEFEVPIQDDDDEFKDEEWNELNLGKSLRNRSSNTSRVSLRGGKTLGVDDDSGDDGSWNEVPNRPRRTRSGRVVGGSLGADSASEWEGDGVRIRTRSRSQNTKSSRRAASSSLSLTSLPDIREDDSTFRQTGDDSLEFTVEKKNSPQKKRQQRIITSPSESEHEDGDNANRIPVIESNVHDTGAKMDNPFDGYGFMSGFMSAQIPLDHLGHFNGLTSDDQMPETPQVVITEDQTQPGTSDGSPHHEVPHTKVNGWLHEQPAVSYQMPHPLLQEMNGIPHANGIDMKLFQTSPPALLAAEMPDQSQRGSSEDAVMKAVGVGWPGLEVEDDMEMCEEDAEGEDDLTYMA